MCEAAVLKVAPDADAGLAAGSETGDSCVAADLKGSASHSSNGEFRRRSCTQVPHTRSSNPMTSSRPSAGAVTGRPSGAINSWSKR